MLGVVPLAVGGLAAASAPAARAASNSPAPSPSLEAKIQEVMGRSEFQGARWGMTIRSLDSDQPMYTLNPTVPYHVGSTYKLQLAATALSAIGPDYRFRTRVYRTGPVEHRVLKGDLVLVAGGDLLIGGRVQADGSVSIPVPDHANGQRNAVPLPNPLQTLRMFARRVRACGVRRIEGRVLVDTSLFREGQENISMGDIVVPVTPIMVNDNVIDVTVKPGRAAGAPATLIQSPDLGYVRIVNEVTTISKDAGQPKSFEFADDAEGPDGTRTVRMKGEISLAEDRAFASYYVRGPARFAELAFTEALRVEGVRVEPGSSGRADTGDLSSHFTAGKLLVDYASPPVSEAVKIMSNLHHVHWPYLVGAIGGKDPVNAKATGERFQRELIRAAGLDPDIPGSGQRMYSSDFYVQFMSHLTRQSYFPHFRRHLSVMGRSGSLANVQVGSPATGYVFARAGHVAGDVAAIALTGYVQPANGKHAVFSQLMEADLGPSGDYVAFWDAVTEAQGEIATAIWRHLAQ